MPARQKGVRQIGTDPTSSDVDDDLGAFFAEHGQRLLTFAFLLTGGQAAQAEDLVHNMLARLVARGLQGLDSPVSYARRGIVNEYRSIARHSAVQRRGLLRLAAGAQAGTATGGTEDRLAVLGALDVLTDRERAAVVLRYYEDLPDEDIAAIVGCSRPTVRSLVHRAMPKLRTALGETYGRRGEDASGSSQKGDRDD